jgi:hypothetical protein
VRHENKPVTVLSDAKAKVTAKVDEVKAIRETQTEFRMKVGKPLGKITRSDFQVTLHLCFATAFTISILTCICVTFTIFILTFNPFLFDHLDHHCQPFTAGNLRVCEIHCSPQRTPSSQAKTAVTTFANPDSTRSSRVPGLRPEPLYRNLCRNTLVPKHSRSLDGPRNSENDPYNDSFIFNYLDSSR